MGDEPEITQVEKVPSEIPPLDKILNSKYHNNVGAKNKDDQKNKRQDSPKKKEKGFRKRKYTNIHHQRTQILTMAHHQNPQREKCPRMNIPH